MYFPYSVDPHLCFTYSVFNLTKFTLQTNGRSLMINMANIHNVNRCLECFDSENIQQHKTRVIVE